MKSLSFHRLSGLIPKSRTRLFTLVAAFAVIAVYAALPAFAVHDIDVFELDGNATNAPLVAGDDWDNVYCQVTNLPAGCSDTSASGGATSVSWTNDGGRSATIFTGGGSKDDLNINPPPGPGTGWGWKNGGGLPDKDNLLDSFAARYTCDTSASNPCSESLAVEDGDVLLYFGADRFANSGDAQIGFWFLQGDITNEVGGTFGPDTHEIGDILILSDFTGGGGTTHIRIFKWDPTDPTAINGTLVPLGGSETTSADCQLIGDDDGFCATVNSGPTASPWPFTDKTGNTSFSQGEFYEGGLNLSAFPELAGECFASFLSETRSSQSVDATLKDFVVGQFERCESGIQTDASAGPVSVGGTFTDTATVTGSGAGAPTGTVTFTVCGPFATPTACTTGDPTAASAGVKTLDGTSNPSIVTSDAVSAAAVGYYCFLGVYSGDTHYPSAQDNDISRECVQVVTIPTTTTTRQFVFPQDAAKIAASAGGNLAGSVRFRLYDTLGNCTADGGTAATGLLYEETDAISGASTQVTKTNNTTVAITSNTTVFWRVFYDSTNPAQDDSESACTESTQVTYAGNDGTITVP
jgi:hypothetical protein